MSLSTDELKTFVEEIRSSIEPEVIDPSQYCDMHRLMLKLADVQNEINNRQEKNMAVLFEFHKDGKKLTLNQMDEYLCEEQGTEVSDSEYCALYEYVSAFAFKAKTHEVEVVDIIKELKELFGDRDWFVDNEDKLIEIFSAITMTRWKE